MVKYLKSRIDGFFFFCKQKTASKMRISDWSSDVCSSDLNMLFGTSVTELTGQVVRRSGYCSRDASGERSVVRFAQPAGNIPFVPAKHDFGADGSDTKCRICGAPADLERGEKRENYAYAFIHGAYPGQEMSEMKFDVIVGNPPYQVGTEGHGATASTIYNHFVT